MRLPDMSSPCCPCGIRVKGPSRRRTPLYTFARIAISFSRRAFAASCKPPISILKFMQGQSPVDWSSMILILVYACHCSDKEYEKRFIHWKTFDCESKLLRQHHKDQWNNLLHSTRHHLGIFLIERVFHWYRLLQRPKHHH